jgi:hypothetical protein
VLRVIPELERKLTISFNGRYPNIRLVGEVAERRTLAAAYDRTTETILVGERIAGCDLSRLFENLEPQEVDRARGFCRRANIVATLSHEIGHHYVHVSGAFDHTKRMLDELALRAPQETAAAPNFLRVLMSDYLIQEGIAEYIGGALFTAREPWNALEYFAWGGVGESDSGSEFSPSDADRVIEYASAQGGAVVGPVLDVDFAKGYRCLAQNPLSIPIRTSGFDSIDVYDTLTDYRKRMIACARAP